MRSASISGVRKRTPAKSFRNKSKGRKAMKTFVTRANLIAMAAVLILAVVSKGGGVPAAVHYIGHDKVTEVMTKGGPIVSDPGLVVLAQRRGAGQVELHDHTNHVFVVVEGE